MLYILFAFDLKDSDVTLYFTFTDASTRELNSDRSSDTSARDPQVSAKPEKKLQVFLKRFVACATFLSCLRGEKDEGQEKPRKLSAKTKSSDSSGTPSASDSGYINSSYLDCTQDRERKRQQSEQCSGKFHAS